MGEFRPGDRVSHPELGEGVVQDTTGQPQVTPGTVGVRFSDYHGYNDARFMDFHWAQPDKLTNLEDLPDLPGDDEILAMFQVHHEHVHVYVCRECGTRLSE